MIYIVTGALYGLRNEQKWSISCDYVMETTATGKRLLEIAKDQMIDYFDKELSAVEKAYVQAIAPIDFSRRAELLVNGLAFLENTSAPVFVSTQFTVKSEINSLPEALLMLQGMQSAIKAEAFRNFATTDKTRQVVASNVVGITVLTKGVRNEFR